MSEQATAKSEWAHVSFAGSDADGIGISSRRTATGVAEIVNGFVRGIFFLHWDGGTWIMRASSWDAAREQANGVIEGRA